MRNQQQIVLIGVALSAGLAFRPASSLAQNSFVTAQVELAVAKSEKKGVDPTGDLSNVVIWLSPADGRPLPKPAAVNRTTSTITQQNKSFTPHVLAVQVGAVIQFPNRDRFLHNVFSLHDGRQFDLGFYEAGSARTVRFDRPGVSYLFCNIHPEMTAAVIAVETPYFGQSDSQGHLTIHGVAEGIYVLHVWAERSLPEDLKKLESEVTVSSGATNLGVLHLRENPKFTTDHTNKYGQNYVPPATMDYNHP